MQEIFESVKSIEIRHFSLRFPCKFGISPAGPAASGVPILSFYCGPQGAFGISSLAQRDPHSFQV